MDEFGFIYGSRQSYSDNNYLVLSVCIVFLMLVAYYYNIQNRINKNKNRNQKVLEEEIV